MSGPYLRKDFPQIAFAIKRTGAKGKQIHRPKLLPKELGPAKIFKENDSSKPKNLTHQNHDSIESSESSEDSLGKIEPINKLSIRPKMIGNTRITTSLTNELNTHTFMIGLRVDGTKQFTTCVFLSANWNDYKYKEEEVFSVTGECFIASLAASASGQHVLAVSSKGVIYKTENYGQPGSWTIDEKLKGIACKQVVINREGQYVLVLTSRELYMSNDYGQTFTSVFELDDSDIKGRNKLWFTSVSLDKESMKISIQTNAAQVYLSEDMGATFIVN